MNTIRVVVVEDQWMIRDGLASLADVSDHIDVVATGADGDEALRLVAEHRPDVVLMDIKMPNLDGIEATRRLSRSHPGVAVLVLTTFEDDELVHGALAAGAAGYLTKDIAAEDLADAITTAARGIVQMTPQVAARLVRPSGPGATGVPDASRRIAQLTRRERDVLRLLATGATNREIGVQLHLSAGTVKNHVSAILRQLGLSDRTSAAVMAARLGLDRPGDRP